MKVSAPSSPSSAMDNQLFGNAHSPRTAMQNDDQLLFLLFLFPFWNWCRVNAVSRKPIIAIRTDVLGVRDWLADEAMSYTTKWSEFVEFEDLDEIGET